MQALRSSIVASATSKPSLPQRAVRVQASKASKVRYVSCWDFLQGSFAGHGGAENELRVDGLLPLFHVV